MMKIRLFKGTLLVVISVFTMIQIHQLHTNDNFLKVKTTPKLDKDLSIVTCVYNFRIIVLTFNRAKSLYKVLHSLANIKLDGDNTRIDVWIDQYPNGTYDKETVDVANMFQWNQGDYHVNYQVKHVGLIGQWLYTWNPKKECSEIGLILEDDVDISEYAYLWLKAAHKKYGNYKDNGGYSLYEGAIAGLKKPPSEKTAFMHARIGTQGFAPNPPWWRKFQNWYTQIKYNTSFHPYVSNDPLCTKLYKIFEKSKKTETMWSIWHIYFADKFGLYTIFPNIAQAFNNESNLVHKYLAYHRKENGLHFRNKATSSETHLITTWSKKWTKFPDYLEQFNFQGQYVKAVNS